MAQLTFLGTGTSTGVPQMRCNCEVCRSTDPHDKRLRCSAIYRPSNSGSSILIDCGPDFREQMLRTGCPDLQAALLTHTHFDHVGGIDDLRPYTHTAKDHHFPLYCRYDVAQDLQNRIPYCFAENPYPGVPQFRLNIIHEFEPFYVDLDSDMNSDRLKILPLSIMHAKLPILGFKIGKLAYITDCKTMPAKTLETIHGIDTLVINALRPEEHLSHLNLQQALDVIKLTAPRCAYLTHMSHQMGLHEVVGSRLPDGVALAFDGLSIEIPD